jgi:hypothetical protein
MSRHEAQPAPGVSPVLEIGGEVGAVVVYLARPIGRGELDMEPSGRPADRFHTGIHRRDVGGSTAHVAVFPAVRAGDYDLVDEHGAPFASLNVRGGEVTELDRRAVVAQRCSSTPSAG